MNKEMYADSKRWNTLKMYVVDHSWSTLQMLDISYRL